MRRALAVACAVAAAAALTACGPDCDRLASDYAAAEFALALHLDTASGLDFGAMDELLYLRCQMSDTPAEQCGAERRSAERQRAERAWQLDADRIAARDAYRAACG